MTLTGGEIVQIVTAVFAFLGLLVGAISTMVVARTQSTVAHLKETVIANDVKTDLLAKQGERIEHLADGTLSKTTALLGLSEEKNKGLERLVGVLQEIPVVPITLPPVDPTPEAIAAIPEKIEKILDKTTSSIVEGLVAAAPIPVKVVDEKK